ncbi:hypothetical protein C5612_17240 [Pseudomonas frederiksbergensis]|uniref:Uncharacterized protein n=1 Tax=Pseudomonas frederiksbergensis TaxID=104087 RepID=A0A2S8HKD9_9PSED|nr:hypothetical protein C5612_17240 [Pseudomonas frederiksbergensis]
MGAGLLAKAVCQSTLMLNDKSLSRASPLPHGIFCSIRSASLPAAPTAPASRWRSTARSRSC